MKNLKPYRSEIPVLFNLDKEINITGGDIIVFEFDQNGLIFPEWLKIYGERSVDDQLKWQKWGRKRINHS